MIDTQWLSDFKNKVADAVSIQEFDISDLKDLIETIDELNNKIEYIDECLTEERDKHEKTANRNYGHDGFQEAIVKATYRGFAEAVNIFKQLKI